MDFAFLKQRYDYELERMERLTNAVSQSAGFLTVAGGLLAVMVRAFSYEQAWLTVVFVVAVILAVGAAAVSFCLLAVVYGRRDYEELPYLGELVRQQHDVFKLRLLHGMSEAEETEVFRTRLRKQVIELSDRNAAINLVRSLALERANQALILMLTFTAIAGASYVVDQTVKEFHAQEQNRPH